MHKLPHDRHCKPTLVRNLCAICGAIVLWLLTPITLLSGPNEFESLYPTWKQHRTDCGVRVQQHRRQFENAHGGQGCEHVRLLNGRGTYIHYVHPIDRARLLPELKPSIWIRSTRPGIQFAAQVVLPRSINPSTGAPITTLVLGDRYDQVGRWQRLQIDNIYDQVNRQQAAALSSEYRVPVDVRQAYIDRVILNVYTGPGQVDVWIDDLDVAVPFVSIGKSSTNQEQQPTHQANPSRPQNVSYQGEQLIVDGHPFLPRIVDWRGEPLEWLKELGFNTVWLARPPTYAQVVEARQAGVWLVAPPPRDNDYDRLVTRVLAWDLGRNLTDREYNDVADLSNRLRNQVRTPRPLICAPNAQESRYRRLVHAMYAGKHVVGTSRPLQHLSQLLNQTRFAASPGTPMWAQIFTELSPQLLQQQTAMSGVARVPWAITPSQLRLVSYQAVLAGARGFYFRTHRALTGNDVQSRMRQESLRLINFELRLIEPWLLGGRLDHNATAAHHDIRVFQTDRSRLAVIVARQQHHQHVVGLNPKSQPVQVPAAHPADQAIVMNYGELRHLRVNRDRGLEFAVGNDDVALCVMTQDHQVFNFLRRHWQLQRTKIAEARRLATESCFELTQQANNLLVQQSPEWAEPLNRWNQSIVEEFNLYARHVSANDLSQAHRVLDQVHLKLRQLRYPLWSKTVESFGNPQASPLCATYLSLPLHWGLSRQLAKSNWSGNLLVEGATENLDRMRAAGWRLRNVARADINLSPLNPHGGRYALQVKLASSRERETIATPTATVTVDTPQFNVRRGQMFRFSMWYRIDQGGQLRRFTISDSLGGDDLQQRLHQVKGTSEWRFCEWYRTSPFDGRCQMTLEFAGKGVVSVDDVSVQLLQNSESPRE